MSLRVRLSPLPSVLLCLAAATAVAPAQVFTVGEHTATADLSSVFHPTSVPLPETPISERTRRELVRMLVAEQGFAHMALPLGAGLTLQANGPLEPGGDKYRHMIFEKGESAAPGDRVVITALQVQGNRIILDLNGGPYEKHRFLSHVQFNNNNVVAPQDKATGARVTLVFPHGTPDLSAPEVKSLLEPVLDFGLKSSEQAYADTLPTPLRNAIAAHEVLVGMNHRMVLAALGQPDSKVRERAPAATADPSGAQPVSQPVSQPGATYEEWIYGHVPETVRFVRFRGDRVNLVKIAELGHPLQIHDRDEINGYTAPTPVHEIAMGDAQPAATDSDARQPAAHPTLRRPGDPEPAQGDGKVLVPANTPLPAASPSH